MTSAASIQAWKPSGDKHLTPCEIDDKDASQFEVKYAGAYCGMPLHFEDSYTAQNVLHALNRCHEAGKLAKLGELRRFLGL